MLSEETVRRVPDLPGMTQPQRAEVRPWKLPALSVALLIVLLVLPLATASASEVVSIPRSHRGPRPGPDHEVPQYGPLRRLR